MFTFHNTMSEYTVGETLESNARTSWNALMESAILTGQIWSRDYLKITWSFQEFAQSGKSLDVSVGLTPNNPASTVAMVLDSAVVSLALHSAVSISSITSQSAKNDLSEYQLRTSPSNLHMHRKHARIPVKVAFRCFWLPQSDKEIVANRIICQ